MAAHFHLLARAQDFLKSPTFRAGLTSAVVMSVGDLTCQAISNSVVDAKESRPKTKALVAETKDVSSSGSSRSGFDLQRTARFGLVGLTLHGPFFYHGMQQLDLRFGPAKSLQMAVQKSLIGQFTLFPTYVTSFFLYMGLLEGRSGAALLDKVKAGFSAAFGAGCIFWPLANVINFRFVPVTGRILYLNGAGLLWNSYLSWTNVRTEKRWRTIKTS
eukprot:TRINITY_DN741_c0_g1_i1.p1 TRINITY_DN741_c0_g1~~TRINITY_DN741_c0_g1_i1.p1  ORF type:complete len:216 (+),score=36.27 TRINITY_DN741_c0_g1_i1:111-758(+)